MIIFEPVSIFDEDFSGQKMVDILESKLLTVFLGLLACKHVMMPAERKLPAVTTVIGKCSF